MARPSIYKKAHRVNIILEKEAHQKAARKAFRLGLRGGFSAYVAQLIAADRRSKRKGAA
jgi:hypothetical protein